MLQTSTMYTTKSFLVIFLVFFYTVSGENICPDSTALHNVSAFFNYYHTSPTEKGFVNFYQLENHTIIQVTEANVSVLCEGMINSFRYLENLALTNASITKIQPEAFKQVPRLTVLSLSVNHLTSIKKEQFKNLHRLLVLYLSANKIQTIDDDAFSELVNIRKIYLDKNHLFEINSNWFLSNPKLALINLAFNRISKIQAGAFTLAKYAKLEIRLQHNAIEEIVPGAVVSSGVIQDIKPQVKIRFDFNTLTEIPDGFVTSLANFTSSVFFNFNVINCVFSYVLEELKATQIEVELTDNPINCPCMQDITNFFNENSVLATFKYNSSYECFLYGVKPPPEWNK